MADLTDALALPKTGLGRGDGPDATGTDYLADISVPPALYAWMGLPAEPKSGSADVLRV